MRKELLCTLGPSSLNDHVITRLEEFGVNLFRLNLSHTKINDLAKIIEYIQNKTSVPICLDTEGPQIRTGNLIDGKVYLRENSVVRIHRKPVAGDSTNFNLYPNDIIDKLQLADFISMENSVLVHIIDIETDNMVTRVLSGGEIGQNKAVTVDRDIDMAALTQKDRKGLAIGREMGIGHVALSFANRGADVDEIRKVFRKDAVVISKIECRNALRNLAEIISKSDALLIDRGDLAHQVPMEQIPRLQKNIISCGKEAGSKVYVATNLMESMVTLPLPTRAEVNDVYNTLADGADGLVLAAETAIGKYPIGCTSMIRRIIDEFENGLKTEPIYYARAPISLIVDPHGGSLVHRKASGSEISDLNKLKSVIMKDTDLMDCEQIACGTYSPLTGFMGREVLESVLNTYQLPNGLPWTMPIVLQVNKECIGHIGEGDRVAVESTKGKVHAILDVNEIYSFDLEEMIEKWFGTASRSHPGVAKIVAGGNTFIGGDVTLAESIKSPYNQYKLTPAETRFIFTKKGWNKVVGFHTRNVPHRVHEFIQLKGLESSHADGLLISPIIGPQKVGDFLPGPVVESYQLMIDLGLYPSGKVVLGCFSTYPRYCGPREAIFTAICRKNMGCTHFIVGRDHTGVGDFYKDSDTRQLFDKLGDIGVAPIFYDAIGYNPTKQIYCSMNSTDTISIAGSEIREALRQNKDLPEWVMRDVIQDMLRDAMTAGRDVFYE